MFVAYAQDRGCSNPGRTLPGYYCDVHQVADYTKRHTTDVNDLTFACGPQHAEKRLRHGTSGDDSDDHAA